MLRATPAQVSCSPLILSDLQYNPVDPQAPQPQFLSRVGMSLSPPIGWPQEKAGKAGAAAQLRSWTAHTDVRSAFGPSAVLLPQLSILEFCPLAPFCLSGCLLGIRPSSIKFLFYRHSYTDSSSCEICKKKALEQGA